MKKTLVYSMRAWKKAVLPHSTSARTWCNGQLEFFANLCMAAKVHKNTIRTDFRVTNEFCWVGKSQIRNPWIMRMTIFHYITLKNKQNTTRNQKGHFCLKGRICFSLNSRDQSPISECLEQFFTQPVPGGAWAWGCLIMPLLSSAKCQQNCTPVLTLKRPLQKGQALVSELQTFRVFLNHPFHCF